MNTRRLYILLCLLTATCSLAMSQPTAFSHFTTTDGLSDNNVLCALRDRYGFMWIGTSNGLNCFDGVQNTVFRNMVEENASFENNTITALYEHEDDIWFGGSFGLYVYHRQRHSFSRFDRRTKYGVSISSTVHDICASANGMVWIGTQGQGLFIYDPRTGQLLQDSRHTAFISDIFTDSDGQVYLATLQGQLLVYSASGEYLRQHAVPDYVADKHNLHMAHIGKQLYIGCERGLYALAPTDSLMVRVSSAGSGIHALAASGGTLLIGTDNGIRSVDPASGDAGGPSPTLRSPVNALMYDRDSTLWVLTRTSGVYYAPSQPAGVSTVRLPAATTKDHFIKSICEGADGSLWIASGSGLFRHDPHTQQTSAYGGATYQQDINALMAVGNDLWIGTQHSGIIVLNTTTGQERHYHYSPDQSYTVPTNEITSMLCTRRGTIYVGTSWGLCRYERSTDNFMWYFGIGSQTNVTSLAEDKNGCVWVATSNHGLFRQVQPDGDFANYTYHRDQELSIGSNDISTVFCDSHGTVWAAPDGGGLCRYVPASDGFETFGATAAALQNQQVYFIVEDHQGCLWMGTEYGMVKLGTDRDASRAQQLRSFEATTQHQKPHNSAIITRQGELIVGYQDEFARFMPQHITFAKEETPVYITALTLPYQLADDASGGQTAFYWPFKDDGVTLPYADNSFTLHFSAPQFITRTSERRFEYMLQGVDKTWVSGTKNAEATYINVPPGTYTFLLRQAGVDDGSVARMTVTVLPPWYRTTLAYIVYGLLIAALLIIAVHQYNRRMRRRYDRRMQEYQAEQEKANFQSKIRFFIDLVHEIRTPLTLMSLPLEEIEGIIKASPSPSKGGGVASPSPSQGGDVASPSPSQGGDVYIDKANQTSPPSGGLGGAFTSPPSGGLGEAFNAIHRNMNYLLGITNELLDFQKADSGNMQLNMTSCDVGQLLSDVCSQFTEAARLSGKRLQLQLPDQRVTTTLDQDKVKKVMMNLVGNAMKYARTEMIVRLELTDSDAIRISVIDDGPGVPEQERDKIFDLYYQIGNDSVAATLGTGLGLSYAKRIAKAHQGDLLYEDAPGGGSCFQLVVASPSPSKGGGVYIDKANQTSPPSGGLGGAFTSPSSGGLGGAFTSPPSGGLGEAFLILLVEDNEELLQMTANALKAHFRIVKAHDGVEALDVLQYNDVDIIVSDVMMPRMDGNELCRRLKDDINYSHIPIILLTAKTSVEAKVEGMQSGADVYLEKPFSTKQLVLQITSLLRMRQLFHERMRQIGATTSPASQGEASSEGAAETAFGLNQHDLLFMERLQQMVSANMSDEEFSIDLLAEQMNMSRSSFYRKIKALTDMTPIEYLKMRRLDQAAVLLQQGIRITEVASRVGFTSSSYFAKCFKARFDCLPKDYAEKMKNELNARGASDHSE